ncbi:MAG: class I SAM-dependent methyltransferase, partial [Gracilimonas sp.]
MKIRESGMPDDKIWASFFDVPFILSEMEINSTIQDLAEIGYGYGTFTIPAAQRISGTMYAFDIDQGMKSIVEEKLVSKEINNIHLQTRDVIKYSTGLPDRSVDYVMLFNILHH